MTTGQINIWRYDVERATRAAIEQRRSFSSVRSRIPHYLSIQDKVARATFCAMVDGDDYSRYPRR